MCSNKDGLSMEARFQIALIGYIISLPLDVLFALVTTAIYNIIMGIAAGLIGFIGFTALFVYSYKIYKRSR